MQSEVLHDFGNDEKIAKLTMPLRRTRQDPGNYMDTDAPYVASFRVPDHQLERVALSAPPLAKPSEAKYIQLLRGFHVRLLARGNGFSTSHPLGG